MLDPASGEGQIQLQTDGSIQPSSSYDLSSRDGTSQPATSNFPGLLNWRHLGFKATPNASTMGTPADLGRDGRAPGRVFGTIVTSHRSPIGTGMTGSFPPGRSMLASGAGIGWWWLMLDFGAHFGKCWGSAALFFETCPFVCFYLLQADHHDKSFPADSLKWFHRSTALVACNPRH